MKTFRERVLKTLSIVDEDWFKRNSKGENLFIRSDVFGYKIGARGQKFFDKKGNGIPTREITTYRTKKETIEKFEEYMNQQQQAVKEAVKKYKLLR